MSTTKPTRAKERAMISKGAITSKEQLQPQQNDEELNQPAVRNIMGYIDKFDRAELQELLSCMTSNWLLSIDDFKLPIEHPSGLITQMAPTNDDHLIILMPVDDTVPNLDYRELHQIVRELTIGIFALNQHPNLVLDANFDESTTCTMPPAYIDTKLGQIMINTDYWLKALWHGAYYQRDRRIKFSERWRQMFDVDANGVPQTKKVIVNDFVTTGLQDVNTDADYSHSYDELIDTEEKLNAQLTDEQIKDEELFFMSCVDDLALQLTMGLKQVKQYKNLYEIDSGYFIQSCIKASNDRVDNAKFERLKRRLNRHEQFLRKNFARKKEVRSNLNVLKLVTFLVPLLMGMKRRMKVPDLNNLLPFMSGDDVRTERELPPLLISPEFKSKIFDFSKHQQPSAEAPNQGKYFHLHGGVQFELETVSINAQCADDYESSYSRLQAESSETLNNYLASETQLQEYPVPITELNGKRYYCLRIDVENYYPQYPQKPFWINKLNDDLSKLKPKRLPMSDINIYDLFKKYFGYKKATKFKNPPNGLKASSSRGLMGIFQSITRKTPAGRLAKHDENGLSFMHHAAIYNRPLAITSLILGSVDVNIKQQIEYLAIGPMALHYAARCCSLDSMSCLLSNYANINFADNNGWAPIHHAAYCDNVPAMKLLLRRQDETKELTTRGEFRWTPILLAASAGSLEAIKFLIESGANWTFHDDKGYNVVHIAAHRNHKNIIEYFNKLNSPQLQATNTIISMLKSARELDQQAAVKCLQGMTAHNPAYNKQILEINGVQQLVTILRTNLVPNPIMQSPKSQQTLVLNTLSVLSNISDDPLIRECLSRIPDITTILTKLLEPPSIDDIQSRAAILVNDVSTVKNEIRISFAEKGCIEKLIKLLESDLEDLLVNTINAIEALCNENELNQNIFSKQNVMISLIELLTLNSDLVKAAVAAAISSIVINNTDNQMLALNQGVVRALINLLKTRNVTVQLKVALALESLCKNNYILQRAILDLGAAEHMINLLKEHTSTNFVVDTQKEKNEFYALVPFFKKKWATFSIKLKTEIKEDTEDWSIVVREQAACTLWALAGIQKPQRKQIAEKIGILQIIIMLLSKSDKLQYVGCKCIIALVLENITNQKVIAKENTIEILLKLLRSEKTSLRVVYVIVQTIAAMCVDVAHVNNAETQDELMNKGAFEILIPILEEPPSADVQIETAHTIACLLLGNTKTEEYVNNKLDLSIIMNLISQNDPELRLSAGKALTTFAYNNTQKQFEIKQLGGISYNAVYEKIIESGDEMQVCKACFQVVVLARVLNDRDKVWATALGISKIVELLNSTDDEVVIQTASYLASLSHTRAGITDAMITCNIVDILSEKLFVANEQIRFASAVTLGYLTFNRTAARLLLHNCRNNTVLYDTLIQNLRKDSKINEEFKINYDTAVKLGLPKLLVHNKVRFIEPLKSANRSPPKVSERPKTSKPANTQNSTKSMITRAQSAPHGLLKATKIISKNDLPSRPQTRNGKLEEIENSRSVVD